MRRIVGIAALLVTFAACDSDPANFFGFDAVNLPDGSGGDAGSADPDASTSDVDPSADVVPGDDAGPGEDATVDDAGGEDAAPSECGNGVRERNELCDGSDVGAAVCTDFGFTGGTLGCGPNCQAYAFDSCTGDTPQDPVCGDGQRTGDEPCDNFALNGLTCRDFGFDRGVLACAPDCSDFDTDACISDSGGDAVCGNGVQEAGELCDGADLGDASCTDFEFEGGDLACGPACRTFVFSGCEEAPCVPQCAGRSCGPDPVCGVSCGSCDDGLSCNSAGQCVSTSGNAPRFITFNTNVRRITEGQTVRFTAVVTDPDGIDDLIGGTLRDEVSANTYGSFTTSAAEGSYQLELTWDEIDRVRAINFTDELERVFEAEFFDVAGNRTTQTIAVTLFCDDGPLAGACDGDCRSFTSRSNCGACDNACIPQAQCDLDGATYACECPAGWGVCDGACVDLSLTTSCGACDVDCTSADGLGVCVAGVGCACAPGFTLCGGECVNTFSSASCGSGCEVCSDAERCDGFSCIPAADTRPRINPTNDTLEVFRDGTWRGVCDDSFGTPDATVACRDLGGELVGFRLSRSGSGAFWMDDLACSGDEGRLASCPFAGWGSENCSTGEHVTVTCEPVRSTPCRSVERGAVVINELLHNPTGIDGSSGSGEFLELRGTPNLDISDTEIAFFTGSDGSEYRRIILPTGTRIPGDGYLVIGGSSIANVDLANTSSIQNGPDSIVLFACDGSELDALAYGNVVGPVVLFGEGFPAPGGAEANSIGRDAAGTDTDDNFADFRASSTPTPGAPNARGSSSLSFPLTRSFTVSSSDPVFRRPSEFCATTSTERNYEVLTFENSSDTDYTVDVLASYSAGDGWLVVYDEAFDSTSSGTNCLGSNDDGPDGTVSSILREIPFRAGASLVVVLTTYDPTSTAGSVTGTVTISESP
jgi:hypothetical protein